MFHLSLILGVLFTLLSYADGATFNVSSESEAQTAINQAKSGDEVIFAKGTYRMCLNTKANGVTFKAESPRQSTIEHPASGDCGGKQIVTVRHDNISLIGLMINGSRRPNSGHGLIRVGTSKNLRIMLGGIINSGSGSINLGGSIKNSRIENVLIRGNYICESGIRDQYGENLYFGDYAGTGLVKEVMVVGNEICFGTDNFLDVKPPARDIIVKHNWFHDQIKRHGQSNYGAIVFQGIGGIVEDNIFESVNSGKAVFNLNEYAKLEVRNNVITGAQADKMVRSRGRSKSSATKVEGNLWCEISSRQVETSKGLVVQGNHGLDLPAKPCGPRIAEIKQAMAQYQATPPPVDPPSPPPPEPPPVALPEIVIDRITYGETGSNVVRVYVRTVGPGTDPQMEQRSYTDGSVRFSTELGTPLAFAIDESYVPIEIDRQKPAPPEREPGWNFYLARPYPTESGVRMQADAGWITGAPAIDQVVERWGVGPIPPEPPPVDPPLPDPVVIEMAPGDIARCDQPVTVTSQTNGSGTRVECQE